MLYELTTFNKFYAFKLWSIGCLYVIVIYVHNP